MLEHIITNAITILDVGAGEGEHSFYCSELNKEANIYAFEPSSVMHQLFQKHITDRKTKNITLLNYAIGHKVTKARLQKKDEMINLGGLYVKKTDDIEEVQMVSIDCLNLTRCDYIKIEGIEEYVLLGAQKTIERFKPAILFKKQESKAFLSNMGYTFYDTDRGILAILAS